jgi:hypothetical protein
MIATQTERSPVKQVPDRVCKRCLEEWPDDAEFYRVPTTPWCIACEREAGRKGDAKRWRSPEAIALKQIRDRERNAVLKAARQAAKKAARVAAKQ